MSDKVIGLHASLYVSPDLLQRCRDDARRIPARLAVSDKVSSLETLALLLLEHTANLPEEWRAKA